MTTPVKLVGFVAAVAAVFGIALGVGNAVGPVSEPIVNAHGDDHADSSASHQQDGSAADTETPGGLMVAQNGYGFRLTHHETAAGHDVPVAFTITGPDGHPVTAYDVEHDKRLHLIAVRRDFTGFQHVHPALGENGEWTTRLDLTPGQWRLFADFTATGAQPLTLGNDLSVAGEYRPAPPTGEIRTAKVDGYTVTIEGDLSPGTDARLTLSVSKAGHPVTDLQPYLGAYGHLVALREGDLAYLHVHPDGAPGDGSTAPGPDVVFYAAVPSPGTYRLYMDFQHAGVVRTAAFTVPTTGIATAPSPPVEAPGAGHSGH